MNCGQEGGHAVQGEAEKGAVTWRGGWALKGSGQKQLFFRKSRGFSNARGLKDRFGIGFGGWIGC